MMLCLRISSTLGEGTRVTMIFPAHRVVADAGGRMIWASSGLQSAGMIALALIAVSCTHAPKPALHPPAARG